VTSELIICMSFTLQATRTPVNVNSCHWYTCKLVFTGTRKRTHTCTHVYVNTTLVICKETVGDCTVFTMGFWPVMKVYQSATFRKCFVLETVLSVQYFFCKNWLLNKTFKTIADVVARIIVSIVAVCRCLLCRILLSQSQPLCCCFSPNKPTLVFAGMVRSHTVWYFDMTNAINIYHLTIFNGHSHTEHTAPRCAVICYVVCVLSFSYCCCCNSYWQYFYFLFCLFVILPVLCFRCLFTG